MLKFHHVIITLIMSYTKNINTITFIIFKPSTGGFNWWTGCHILTSFSQTVSWYTTDSFWNSFTQQCWKERSAVKKEYLNPLYKSYLTVTEIKHHIM